MSRLRALVGVLLTVGLSACAHDYYKVTDPGSGKTYYTEDIKRNGSAVEFRDAQTGGVTTLQNSEIVQIKKEAYETAVGTAKK